MSPKMSPDMPPEATLSTHILNLDAGAPAADLAVELRATDATGNPGELLARLHTNEDGRAADWPALSLGTYQLSFLTGDWYSSHSIECFYPRVSIEFRVDSVRHYHVPLLLNRFGFSSYRGS